MKTLFLTLILFSQTMLATEISYKVDDGTFQNTHEVYLKPN